MNKILGVLLAIVVVAVLFAAAPTDSTTLNNDIVISMDMLDSELWTKTLDFKVDTYQAGFVTVNLNTDVSFCISQIIMVNPQTSFTGLTYGYYWNELICFATISADKKSASIYASGELQYCLLTKTPLTKIAARSVSLTGKVWLE